MPRALVEDAGFRSLYSVCAITMVISFCSTRCRNRSRSRRSPVGDGLCHCVGAYPASRHLRGCSRQWSLRSTAKQDIRFPVSSLQCSQKSESTHATATANKPIPTTLRNCFAPMTIPTPSFKRVLERTPMAMAVAAVVAGN